MLLVSLENLEGVNSIFFLERSNARFFCLPTWLWPPSPSAVSLVYLLLRLSRPVPCVTGTGPVCSTGFDRCRVIQSHAVQLESFPLRCDLSFHLHCWDAHMKWAAAGCGFAMMWACGCDSCRRPRRRGRRGWIFRESRGKRWLTGAGCAQSKLCRDVWTYI